MEESKSIAGLVQPYTNNSEISTNALKGKENRIDTTLIPYPYSIYDDDSSTDHYFLVPGSKVDICRFKRDFIQLNNLKRIQNNESIYTNTSNLRHPLISKHPITRTNISQSSGEYCFLAQNDKKYLQKPQSLCSKTSLNINNKAEFKNFSAKFSGLSTSDTEPVQKTHSFHNRHKLYDTTLHTTDKKIQKQMKRKYQTDNFIDCCTCIVCVKAIDYHFNPDDTGKTMDVCSCSGSFKSVSRRWFCLGILAVFFPCLFCYIPLKLCQRESTDSCPRTKLKETYEARYVKGPYLDPACSSLL